MQIVCKCLFSWGGGVSFPNLIVEGIQAEKKKKKLEAKFRSMIFIPGNTLKSPRKLF